MEYKMSNKKNKEKKKKGKTYLIYLIITISFQMFFFNTETECHN